MSYALLALASSHWRHVVTVNAWGAGTGAAGTGAAGERGLVASDVGAAATARAEAVVEVAMCKFEVVEVGPGQARCDLIARSSLLQLAC